MQADADEETAAAAAAAAAGFSDDNADGEESGEDVYIPDFLWDEYKVCGHCLTVRSSAHHCAWDRLVSTG
jgi:hypothetical protein